MPRDANGGRADALDRLAWAWPWLIVLYFVGEAALRVLLSPTLTLDEAQQALFAQELRLGYDEQPPLYSWVVFFLIQVFGVGAAALASFKAILLIALYLFTFAAVRRVAGAWAGMLASASLFLVPQIGWELQRDLTHSVLTMAALSALVYFLILVVEKRDWASYLGLSLSCAVGLLAKPNFVLVAGTLIVALLLISELRRQLRPGALVLALLLALALAAPAYLWQLGHLDEVLKDSAKLGLDHAAPGSLEAMGRGLAAIAEGLGSTLAIPFALWLVITKGFTLPRLRAPQGRLLLLAGVIALVVVCVSVLALGVTKVRVRYVLPIIYLPLIWAPLVYADSLARWWQRWPLPLVGLAGALVVTLGLAVGHRFAPAFDLTNRLQTHFAAFAGQLQEEDCRPDAIVAAKQFLAGNLRVYFPDVPTSGPQFVANLDQKPSQVLLVWWDWQQDGEAIVDQLAQDLGLSIPSGAADSATLPMLHTAPEQNRNSSFAYRCLELAG